MPLTKFAMNEAKGNVQMPRGQQIVKVPRDYLGSPQTPNGKEPALTALRTIFRWFLALSF